MGLHLAETGRQVAHGVVVLAGAANLTLLPLPSHAPELNPIENAWEYLRQNKLSHRVWEGCDAIVATCCDARNWLMAAPDRLTPVTRRERARTVTG
jgi:transposase